MDLLPLNYLGVVSPITPDLHILTACKANARSRLNYKVHYVNNEPKTGCIVHVEKKIEAVTPEMCFLQMAKSFSLEQLIELGFELCGKYVLVPPCTDSLNYLQDWGRPSSPDFKKIKQPITTPDRLRCFLGAQSGFVGLDKAKRAARYVLPNSASPRESALAMMLSLPYMLGGYGLRNIVLNCKVPLSEAGKRTLGYDTCAPDIMPLGSKVAVEYDSDACHSGETQRLIDSRRRSALHQSGFEVFEITTEQYGEFAALRDQMLAILKSSGKRLRPQCENYEAKQRELYLKLRHVSHELQLF